LVPLVVNDFASFTTTDSPVEFRPRKIKLK
jgi:hypothetical protein